VFVNDLFVWYLFQMVMEYCDGGSLKDLLRVTLDEIHIAYVLREVTKFWIFGEKEFRNSSLIWINSFWKHWNIFTNAIEFIVIWKVITSYSMLMVMLKLVFYNICWTLYFSLK
jgi:serine/threonine protein kinase